MSLSYLGHDVLDVREWVDLKDEVGYVAKWFMDQYQYDAAHNVARFFESLYPEHLLTMSLAFDSLDGYAEARDFFKDHCGALYPFWLMLPCRFFELVAPIVGTEDALTIRHVGYAASFLESEGTLRHLYLSDGTNWNARKAISAVDGDEEDVLTLNEALDLDAVDAEDAVFFPLFFCRFEQDTLTSQWPELSRHASVAVTCKELSRDYPG